MALRLDETGGRRGDEFRHEALFYAGDDEFVEACAAFVLEGLEAGEPVLVAVIPRKIALLENALGGDAERVRFVDMAALGRNPARIIPVWQEFLACRPAPARSVRGIGEPIWAGRTGEEIVEAQRHETLINLAFHDAAGWILCPYDTASLGPDVLEEAYRSHPLVALGGSPRTSESYRSIAEIAGSMDRPLPPPSGEVEAMEVSAARLAEVRARIAARAAGMGMPAHRIGDLKLAVSELAANTLVHGGGSGVLRLWSENGELVLEIVDSGIFDEPLVGRRAPSPLQEGGRGMWMVNQLCDLVQMRTLPEGSVVRIRMSIDRP